MAYHFQEGNCSSCSPTVGRRSLKSCDLAKNPDHGLWRILCKKVCKYFIVIISALLSYKMYKHARFFKNTREVLEKHEPQANASHTS